MNIIQKQNLLKNASDEMLERYLANPTGEYPEYLVASEKLRRKDMRDSFAAESQGRAPKTSIIEELLQRDNAALRAPTESAVPQMPVEMPTSQGLGSVPPPADMQMTPPPMLAAAQEAPQDFYDGGVVALAEGGGISDVADAFNEYMRPMAQSNERGYRVGVSPSLPIGRGSIDVNAAAVGSNESFDGPMPMPNYSGYQGRVGASYPIGEGNLRAGISGISNKYGSDISGYDIGYNDERNRLMANIMPTPEGNAYGINYGSELGRDSLINAGLMRDPRGQMSGNIMYTKRFAHGGDVQRFQLGGAPKVAPGYAPDLTRFDVNPQLMQIQEVPQVYDLPYYQKQMTELVGPSGTEGYQEALAKQRETVEGRKKNYLSDFLIRSGLGMASSKSPFALQAAAQGLADGFEDFQKAKEADTAAERALTESEFKFKQAQRAENMGLLGLSRQQMADAVNARNSAVESNRAAESLKISAATGREAAMRGAYDIGLRGEEVALRAREIAAANQRHKENMAMEEKRIKAQVERDNAITPAIRVNAANVVSDAVVRYRKQLEEFPPQWYESATSKIESLPTGSVAQQVEMQRLENLIRMRSGVSEDILKIAGFQ